MLAFDQCSLSVLLAVFLVMTAAVFTGGTLLTRLADHLSRRTGLGQVMMGAVFLGAVTSLSGITTSVTAAWNGFAELAASNAVGGIAAQTLFLAVADFFYRRANLEHAAATDENMLQATLLIGLCGLALLSALGPEVSVFGIHPGTVVLLLSYFAGQLLVKKAETEDMWRPRLTRETQQEEEDNAEKEAEIRAEGGEAETLSMLWVKFCAAAAVIGLAGYFLAKTGAEISVRTGINQSIVGGLFTAVATSLPELVTTVAAVRRGALNLAVAGIIGGNAFDVIFFSISDVAYREGSLYHAMGGRPVFLLSLTIVMTTALLLGLIRREKHGVANIGFESILVFALYLMGFAILWYVPF